MKFSEYVPDATGVQRRGEPTERLIILTLAAVRCMATAERIHDLTRVPKVHVRKTLNRLVDRGVIHRLDVATSIAGDEEVALFQFVRKRPSMGYPKLIEPWSGFLGASVTCAVVAGAWACIAPEQAEWNGCNPI